MLNYWRVKNNTIIITINNHGYDHDLELHRSPPWPIPSCGDVGFIVVEIVFGIYFSTELFCRFLATLAWKTAENGPLSSLNLAKHLDLFMVNLVNLVGGLEHFLFFHILGIIIPTDEFIFFRGVGWNHQPGKDLTWRSLTQEFWPRKSLWTAMNSINS